MNSIKDAGYAQDVVKENYAVSPTDPRYWKSKRRLTLLKRLLADNNRAFQKWVERALPHEYRAGALDLVRMLKSFPEWEGLTDEEAARSLDIAFRILAAETRRERHDASDEDDWGLMFEDTGMTQIEPRDEFMATWLGAKFPKDPYGRDPLALAKERAEQQPIGRSEDLEDKLGTCSSGLLRFLSFCCYLQQLNGAGYIILPQDKIGQLLGVDQRQISRWCKRLKYAGILVVAERYIPKQQAIRWRCNLGVDFKGATL
jgi:hypothetical protein